MNYAGLLIPFSIWLTLFVYRFAVAAFLRRRKKSQANDEDLISQLLDDILISIIARLPTKEAVRSSILSNRWRNLYKSVPDIKLECVWLVGTSPCYQSHFCLLVTPPCYHGPNEFINAVDRFLRLRSGFKIRKLNLKCCAVEPNTDLFEQFICSLGRLGIEGLRLTCSEQCFQFAFSCHLISRMPSLKSLYLFGFILDHQIPHPFKLNQTNNSLQVLKLTHVVVADGALGCILSNCLSLHALKLVACGVYPKLSICGPRLRLESLCIRDCWDMGEIELYASNLVSFEFQCSEIVIFRYEHVPKLQTLFINFRNKDTYTMSYVCTKLARDLPNLKSLVFSECGIYQFSAITMGFNMFKYLRQLFIHLLTSDKVNMLSLAPFLQMCPLLQEFHLETVFSEKVNGQERREVRRPDAVIHSELKKVEIIGHCGTKSEIEFALYILKSAMCLEQMRISRCRESGQDKTAWSKKTLEMIHSQLQGKAISKNARLTIQHSTRNCVTFPIDGFY